MFSIEFEKIKLITEKPFYGILLNECHISVTEEVPTMGINVTGRINLYINPKFWASLKGMDERLACIEHELLHLINEHPLRGKGKENIVFNIAADMAINQYIQNLPKGGVTLGQGFEALRETEYYYKQLMKNAKVMEIQMPGNGQSGKDNKNNRGDHKVWQKSTASKSLQKQIIRDKIIKTVEKCGGLGQGNLPERVKEAIQSTLNEHQINWQTILRNLINKYQKGKWYSTWKRPNRRFNEMKGQLRENEFRLLVALDTSGSIDTQLLKTFLNEVDFLKNYCRDVIVVECDTQIHKEYKLKNKAEREVQGRGGTDFRPVFERAKKIDPSLIVYFTDGAGNFPDSSLFPTLWVLYNTKSKAPFGKSMFQKMTGNGKI